MIRRRDAAASRSRYFRSEASRTPRRTFLIVTEGAKTEPKYLRALVDGLKLATVHIRIEHSTGTDPVGLTQYAIKLRDERARKARHGDGVDYDEVWVVFDLEAPTSPRRVQSQQARQLPGAGRIQFAVSDPCFEYFLLLHYETTTTAFSDCAGVIDRLRSHWIGYAKGASLPANLLERVSKAVGRAKVVRDLHAAQGGFNSPSTDIDRLLVQLNPENQPSQNS